MRPSTITDSYWRLGPGEQPVPSFLTRNAKVSRFISNTLLVSCPTSFPQITRLGYASSTSIVQNSTVSLRASLMGCCWCRVMKQMAKGRLKTMKASPASKNTWFTVAPRIQNPSLLTLNSDLDSLEDCRIMRSLLQSIVQVVRVSVLMLQLKQTICSEGPMHWSMRARVSALGTGWHCTWNIKIRNMIIKYLNNVE